MSGRDEKPQKVKDIENEASRNEIMRVYGEGRFWHDMVRETWEKFRLRREEAARRLRENDEVYRRAFTPTRLNRRTILRQWLTDKLKFVFDFFSNEACAALFIAIIANMTVAFLCFMNLFFTEIYLLFIIGGFICTMQAVAYVVVLKEVIDTELRI